MLPLSFGSCLLLLGLADIFENRVLQIKLHVTLCQRIRLVAVNAQPVSSVRTLLEIGILVVKIDGRAAVRLGRRLECRLRQHRIRQCQQAGKAADEYGACGSAVRLLCAAVLVWLRRSMPDGVLSVLFLALILVELGSIVPTIVVLKQRLNEIEGGEEDAAAQY